jgi:hypothetical protein
MKTPIDLLEIATRLKDQVAEADAGLTWREKSIAALANSNDEEGIIRCAQIQRDEGGASKEESSHRIAFMAENIAIERIKKDKEIKRIGQAIDAAKKAYGLKDDEYWPRGEGPEDVEQLDDEWDRRFDAIFAAVLREHGEDAMADLLITDKKAFHDLCEKGRAMTYGPLPKEVVED